MTLQLSTLPNGLRVMTDHLPDMHSVALGVWCDVGTRYEDMKLNGIAHLVEHMMFKGTPTRTALDISAQIEAVGGQMNAFTSRETTAYFIHLLKDDMPLALDVLGDIMQNSTFPEEELTKERDVILQEIGMSLDTPDDLVNDMFQSAAYQGQALGAPILGTADIVANMPHAALHEYTAACYTPENIVISAAGFVEHEDFVKRVADVFGGMESKGTPRPAPAASYTGGEINQQKDLEQAHVMLGFQGVSRLSEDYETALLLTTILGGGMSSRLFQEVREKRGLVYSVYSHHTPYRDDGLFEIYAGTGPDKLGELLPVVTDELKKLQDTAVTNTELASAKAQIRASLLMGQESMLSRANRQAKYLLNFGRLPDMDTVTARINSVSSDQIQSLAQAIFNRTKTKATLGP